MISQQRRFSRDLIQKVNQDMIDRKRTDMSGLPEAVQRSIREHRYTREEINRAFAAARAQIREHA
jgi:hypothetical protein